MASSDLSGQAQHSAAATRSLTAAGQNTATKQEQPAPDLMVYFPRKGWIETVDFLFMDPEEEGSQHEPPTDPREVSRSWKATGKPCTEELRRATRRDPPPAGKEDLFFVFRGAVNKGTWRFQLGEGHGKIEQGGRLLQVFPREKVSKEFPDDEYNDSAYFKLRAILLDLKNPESKTWEEELRDVAVPGSRTRLLPGDPSREIQIGFKPAHQGPM
ncbi:uncharacterized protein B0I36DRAFT_388396 [Microdochium trichocladiopsis]|uniref:Uncharacterized protein n=1 Tax=Microdochium trichocladiopsis TaxID=1682393 RepID=A0A9P8XUG7_9PEZI|nr:uncharacterized protein B0I36DRAFT_388396 [Microdochium trichocladiopsis]KAH7018131.1 hypothetical protein B0I36DRAFT_388396 [Microdochium trichocladiopsis]